MGDRHWGTEDFEEHRAHLRGVAHRMLGSVTDAEDAVQEAWLRLERTDTAEVQDLRAWLTTVVSRICLNVLRSRSTRREDLVGSRLPDPIVRPVDAGGPEQDAVLADSVGEALLVVLDTLSPAERVAFVLHDVFALPFDEIAPMVDRTPAAARQLASRARRRVQGAGDPAPPLAEQRALVEAFFAAARAGDLTGLLAVLDPDVVSRADSGPGAAVTARGAEAVAARAMTYANPAADLHPVLVNGAAGVVVTVDGVPTNVMGFTVRDGRIVAIDTLADPHRIRLLDLPAPS